MNKASRNFGLVLVALAVSLLLSTGVSATPTTHAGDLEALGTGQGNNQESASLLAEVNSIERNSAGNIVSVVWSIENQGDSDVVLTWLHDISYAYTGPYFSGVTSTSSDGGTRYHPLMDGEGKCICSGETNSDFRTLIDSNEKLTYWSLFSVPGEFESLTIEIPGFEPIEDVPIS